MFWLTIWSFFQLILSEDTDNSWLILTNTVKYFEFLVYFLIAITVLHILLFLGYLTILTNGNDESNSNIVHPMRN